MAAERYSSEVLQMFYGPIAEQENAGLPQPLAKSIISEAIKNLPLKLREIILKKLYLHKNEAASGTWLGRCSF